MTTFKSYRDLEVWQKAMRLAKKIYQVTQKFPTDERFGLTNQLRRAAVPVPSNIAEGHARFGAGEFSRFLSIAMGSVAEIETQILESGPRVCKRRAYLRVVCRTRHNRENVEGACKVH